MFNEFEAKPTDPDLEATKGSKAGISEFGCQKERFGADLG